MQKVLTKKEYELEARKLIGQKLVAVRYYEINYGSEDEQFEQPMWNQNPDFDSLDFGVELLFQDTNSCFLIWDIKLNCIRFDFGSQEVSTNIEDVGCFQFESVEELFGSRYSGHTNSMVFCARKHGFGNSRMLPRKFRVGF